MKKSLLTSWASLFVWAAFASDYEGEKWALVDSKRVLDAAKAITIANYPDCDFATWNRPVPQRCPKDNGLMVFAGKDQVKCTVCQSVYEYAPEQPEPQAQAA